MRIALPAHIDPAAFADRDPGAAIDDLSGETMGTSWSVRFVRPAGLDAARLEALIAARLAEIVGEMSHWQPETALSRFNAAPAGQAIPLSSDFAFVMNAGLAVARKTAGAFDPTIGRVVDLWGFGPGGPVAPPTDARLDEARAASGFRRIAFSAGARRLRQPGGLALDLSGIAKGFAVDAVADLLGRQGVRNALVEIGGELVGRGIRPDGEPWWVDLENPPGAARIPPLRIALHGLAVATSGNYQRGDHTIDPRTGRPCANGVLSLSVISRSAMDADAWATALTVLGPADGLTAAAAHDIAARFVWQADGATREALTPALTAMLDDQG